MQHHPRRFQPRQSRPRRQNRLAQGAVLRPPFLHERRVVVFIRIPPAHHLDPRFNVARAGHLDRQPKPIQQLRPQLALFRVARPHQHEPRRVADRQPLTLHHILTRLRHIQQQIDDVILQQVHLVDIKIAAIGPRQQPRLERLFATRQGPFNIQRPNHAVLSRPQRQVNHRGRALDHFARCHPRPVRHIFHTGRIHRTAFHRRDFRQQRRQGPHRR